MNLFDFTKVQTSIIYGKQSNFIFNYCILKNINIFPEELILTILHFKFHYMKYQLNQMQKDISMLTNISIVMVKLFHTTFHKKSYILFPDNTELENTYDIAVTKVPIYSSDVEKIIDAIYEINLTINNCNKINTHLYSELMIIKNSLGLHNNTLLTETIQDKLIKFIKNTKPKHIKNIVINI